MVLDLVAIIPQDFFWKREACSALDPFAECDGLLFLLHAVRYSWIAEATTLLKMKRQT
jgi:hypothetical protein